MQGLRRWEPKTHWGEPLGRGDFRFFEVGIWKKVLREPGSKRPKIRRKWKFQETIEIDSGISGGSEEPVDVLVGLFRAIFTKIPPWGAWGQWQKHEQGALRQVNGDHSGFL